MREPNFKFSMIGLSGGEELSFTEDENIKVFVVPLGVVGNEDENMVEYQGKTYALSDFVKKFHPNRNPSGSYQGAKFFKYHGKTLLELRNGISKFPKRKLPLNDGQKRKVKKIIEYYEMTENIVVKAVIESIIFNKGIANYTEHIYPYIKEYYPEIFEPYKNNEGGFCGLINATVQRYTKDMKTFTGKEIFVSKGKGSGTFYVKNIPQDIQKVGLFDKE